VNLLSDRGKRYVLPDMDVVRRKIELIQQHKERGTADAKRRLLSFLADESWHVREAAVAALGDVGGVPVQDLQELASSGLWYSRAAAIQVFGLVGGVEVVPLLVRLSSEENRSVKEAAEEALRSISVRVGPDKVAALLDQEAGQPEEVQQEEETPTEEQDREEDPAVDETGDRS
jgi:HEAT repeat protein